MDYNKKPRIDKNSSLARHRRHRRNLRRKAENNNNSNSASRNNNESPSRRKSVTFDDFSKNSPPNDGDHQQQQQTGDFDDDDDADDEEEEEIDLDEDFEHSMNRSARFLAEERQELEEDFEQSLNKSKEELEKKKNSPHRPQDTPIVRINKLPFPRDPAEIKREEAIKKKFELKLESKLLEQKKAMADELERSTRQQIEQVREQEADLSARRVDNISMILESKEKELEEAAADTLVTEKDRDFLYDQLEKKQHQMKEMWIGFFQSFEETEQSARNLLEGCLSHQLKNIRGKIFEKTQPKDKTLTDKRKSASRQQRGISVTSPSSSRSTAKSGSSKSVTEQDQKIQSLQAELSNLQLDLKQATTFLERERQEHRREVNDLRSQVRHTSHGQGGDNEDEDDEDDDEALLSSHSKNVVLSRHRYLQQKQRLAELERQNEALRFDLEDAQKSSSLKSWCHDATAEMLLQSKRAALAERNLEKAHFQNRELLLEFYQLGEILDRLEKQVEYINSARKLVSVAVLDTSELSPLARDARARLINRVVGANNNRNDNDDDGNDSSRNNNRFDDVYYPSNNNNHNNSYGFKSPRPPSNNNNNNNNNSNTPSSSSSKRLRQAMRQHQREGELMANDNLSNNQYPEHYYKSITVNRPHSARTASPRGYQRQLSAIEDDDPDDNNLQRISRVSNTRRQFSPNTAASRSPSPQNHHNNNNRPKSAAITSGTYHTYGLSSGAHKFRNSKPIPVVGPFGRKTESPYREIK